MEILVDRWGVAHIYASSTGDLYVAQGFNAARDRLWQMDLWRRRGLGLLSEVFGPSFVEKDRAARLFLYRGDMQEDWEAYGHDVRHIVSSFVAGINAYVSLASKNPDLLPEEFRLMGYEPSLWRPEDVPRIRSHGLNQNAGEELARALTLRRHGWSAESIRKRLQPAHEIVVPEGLDLSTIPDDLLRIYELATTPVDFQSASRSQDRRHDEGSNNWVVGPERTSTGRPILANDPHRDQSVPSLRYAVHLISPELNVIGAGEPSLPGVSIGHNDRIAFGLTIFSIDHEDLYIYRTNPENPDEYLYHDEWEAMEIERQAVEVRGGEPVEVKLKFTRHGPIIYADEDRDLAISLRAAWLEPGMAPYLGSVEYMRAGNWEEFLEAMRRWGAPGENQVYADIEGNIGWKPAGLIPRRPNWDGLLPVPGDGRYEWEGFLDPDELPSEFNPSRGWIATANEMNLPDDFPIEEHKIGFEWYPDFRYRRIAEALEADPRLSVQECVALQTDFLSLPARRTIPALRGLRSENPTVERALRMLREWDCELETDSAPAALFEVWYRFHLRPAIVARLLGVEEQSQALDDLSVDTEVGDARVILDEISSPQTHLGTDGTADNLLLSTLARAIEELEGSLGPEMDRWRWGALHHARLVHPLSVLIGEEDRKRMDIGPAARGGSVDTVGNTSYAEDDFRQTGGSSWRLVVDVGSWDDSLMMNSPGQSGDVRSPHYADLFPRWAEDEAVPLLYTRELIESLTEHRIVLHRPEPR